MKGWIKLSGEERVTINFKYTSNQLELLAEPLSGARVIIIIPPYSKLDVLESEGSWFKLKYQDQEGYVIKNLLSTSKYTTTSVRLKSQPKIQSITMFKIPQDTHVEVIGFHAEWSQVFYQNRLGFLLSDQLSDSPSEEIKPKKHSISLGQINLFK